MQIAPPEELPDNYYLANFHSLAGFVFETYEDLLLPEELEWYQSINDCEESAQRLYVRLLTRKGPVFRLSRLKYPEIESLAVASEQLEEKDLANTAAPDELSVLLKAFTKPELISLLSLQAYKSKSRVDLLELILAVGESELQRIKITLQGADRWISIAGHAYWNIYNLCFFGNLYQDTSEFVLRDLGAVAYESYEIEPDCRAFTSRHQIESHMRYFECAVLWEASNGRSADEILALIGILPPEIDGDEHLSRRLDRLKNSMARQLERLGDTENAIQIFASSRRSPARERRVRMYLKDARLDQAEFLINEMMEAPYSESERQVAERLQKQYAKAAGIKLKPEQKFRPETSNLTLTFHENRVEEEARQFYSQFGFCSYTENQLVNSVLGLFIWDIVFYPIQGVFFNPFQSAPSDFYESKFYCRREALLKARFSEIDDSLRFSARIMDNFEKHHGKSNPLVRWGGVTYELLSLALQRVPSTHWRVMFNRILSDTRENMAGFPDLILFKSDTADYEFIEIKGPGDTVQRNQIRWMRVFAENRIPYRVVNVRWAADHLPIFPVVKAI